MTVSKTPRPLFRVSRSYAAQAVDGEWLSRKNRIWVLIALAVGFFARVYELSAQSLWNDEGTSVALAQTSVTAIINAAARDIHPPLYYLLLSGWIQFAGISEFAIRFLSVIAGVLIIAVTFRIAREFFDQDVAVIAAVVSALNPFQVYYAQETRMYIWVTLFAALSVWMMVVMYKPARENHPPPLARVIRKRLLAVIGFVFFTLAALYTNYYAFTIVIVENLTFLAWLVWAIRAKRPRLAHSIGFWIGMQIVIVLAYLPWLHFARQALASWPGISEPMTLWDMSTRILSAYVTGADALRDAQIGLLVLYGIFFVGGLLPSRDLFRQSVWGIATCALWAIVPLLAMYFVSLSRPAYNPKFLLLATPGFLILVARGVSVFYPGLFLRERAPYASLQDPIQNRLTRQLIGIGKLLMGGLFTAGTVLALQNIYSDPRLQRDDYRGIVNYINAVATARDAVIVNAPGQLDVVRYYFNSPAQLVGLPVGRPLQREQTQNVLDELKTRENLYGIFWATEQADPDKFVERYLAENSFKASDEWHGNVRLAEYASSKQTSWESHSPRVVFGDEITLEEFEMPSPSPALKTTVPLELMWRPLKTPPSARYKVFAQLLDAQGQLASQRDSEPQDGFFPTNQWARDEIISDKIAIPIPGGLPPGDYRLIVGMYREDTGERLPVRGGGDFVSLGNVSVAKNTVPPAALFLTHAFNLNFDALTMLGYQIQQTNYARGTFIPLVLYFQAREKIATDLNLLVQLRDQGDNIVSSARAFENYPTTRWDKDEIVRDVQTLNIPPNALPGEYKIVVTDGARGFEVTRVQVR